jgi:glycosyltransferase involved in cell wall biosynthesis
MQVLYISQKPAFPIIDGGSFAINRFLKDVRETIHGEIDCLAITTVKHPMDADAAQHDLGDTITIYPVEINTKLSILSFFASLFSKLPYNLIRYKQTNFLQKINALLAQKEYDYIILDGLYSSVFLHEIKSKSKAKIIYRSHNVEHQIWLDRAATTNNWLKRQFLFSLANKVSKYEKKLLQHLDCIAAISSVDYDFFKLETTNQVEIIPVSMLPIMTVDAIAQNQICFIGNFGWFPNVEGMSWFINKVFPILKIDYPLLTLHIAGFESKEALCNHVSDGIVIHGPVNDAALFIKTHGIFVSPIFSGSGIKIKVLEAMNAGVPMVLSKKSAEGIGFPSEFTCFETKETAINLLKELLSKPIHIEHNQGLMRDLLQEQFSQEVVVKKLKEIIYD